MGKHTQILLQESIWTCFCLSIVDDTEFIRRSTELWLMEKSMKCYNQPDKTKWNIMKSQSPKKDMMFCCHVTMLQPWSYAETNAWKSQAKKQWFCSNGIKLFVQAFVTRLSKKIQAELHWWCWPLITLTGPSCQKRLENYNTSDLFQETIKNF